jgi:tRNA G18 (ribose-2'-O)-methylase SpoU
VSVEPINGPDDPRVADYRNVPDPELVRSRGLFVAEGRLVVRRVIEDGRYRVRSALVSESARQSLDACLRTLPADVPIFVCAAPDFISITSYNIHRGCLALVERPVATTVEQLLAERAPRPPAIPSSAATRTIVVLEAVANADNVGGVFRNAAAFGADGVLLSPACCDPLYRKAIRTSMGASLRVPFSRADEWPRALSFVRAHGFTIVALTPREPAECLDAFASRERPSRIALVLGTEGEGLSTEVEDAADHRVRIPISDEIDSLNVAVAAGIALYALNRR